MTKTPNLPPALRRLLALAASFLLLSSVSGGGNFAVPSYAAGGTALRFYGTGADELDRVKIPLGPVSAGQIASSYPVNMGGDFTIEFWMRAAAEENTAPACDVGWYYGNIILDRDVDGAGDEGDYGVALCDGRIAVGVSVGADDRQFVSPVTVTDGQWHHVAVTRSDGGQIAIFVDGQPAGSTEGPRGSVAYRVNRETAQPESDPYLVLGAEKHGYPGTSHYDGLLDDLRISNVVRYGGPFSRPTGPHPVDASTVALFRFDEGAGTTVGDSSGAVGGPSSGVLVVAGSPASPAWATDTPFTPAVVAPTAALATALPAEPTAALATATALPVAVVPEPALTAAAPEPRPAATPVAPTSVAVGTKTSAESPPPADAMDTLLFAWLAAAAVLGIAIVAGLRWRSCG